MVQVGAETGVEGIEKAIENKEAELSEKPSKSSLDGNSIKVRKG